MEEGSGGGLHTKTDKEYQEAARYTRKGAEIVKREVRTKNGGTERLFNERQRSEPKKKKKGRGRGKRDDEKKTEKQGRKATDRHRERSRKSEGVPETDVALAGPGRLIASGPVPCQALTPLSSAVIYRLRFARFKHYSVVIMAQEGRMTFPGWEQN